MEGKVDKATRKGKCKVCSAVVMKGDVCYITDVSSGRKHKFIMCANCITVIYKQLVEINQNDVMLGIKTERPAEKKEVQTNADFFGNPEDRGKPLRENCVSKIESASQDDINNSVMGGRGGMGGMASGSAPQQKPRDFLDF